MIKDHNWHRGGYGTLTMSQVIEQSSNIGVAKFVNNAFGNDRRGFYGMLDRMCYGQPDSIGGIDGLKATEYCLLKDSMESNMYFLESTIGYKRKVAPIQLLTFYNAIANGGRMVKPTLKNGVTETINPQIATKSSIDSMQVVLENVVVYGLAHKAGTPLVSVAGKHGTAVVNQNKLRELNSDICLNEYQIGFCGYFPAEAPEYSIIVSMNKFGLPASGGGMAAPVFRNIVEWMYYHDMPASINEK